eukprot:TRINITY_DN552_c0_g1_i12.p2 TRINITY_DN552_c0_g1~~TRINITY_DN552_c0_g1_i12.p2  ORF type:complete len:252 (+),score=36.36 TRINITY_DN552_c0_g1_i12:103-858(+)
MCIRDRYMGIIIYFCRNMQSDLDEQLTGIAKIILIGDSGVGKSNLLLRYCKNEFSAETKSTIGVEFESKIVQVAGDKLIKANIWDTAGQERFKTITRAYYKGALGALIVFDLTKYQTFENLRNWIDEFYEYGCQDGIISIVGNKMDLEEQREVPQDQAVRFAQECNCPYFETSALSNMNVNEVFKQLVEELYAKKTDQVVVKFDFEETDQEDKRIENEPLKLDGDRPEKQKDGCCQMHLYNLYIMLSLIHI